MIHDNSSTVIFDENDPNGYGEHSSILKENSKNQTKSDIGRMVRENHQFLAEGRNGNDSLSNDISPGKRS